MEERDNQEDEQPLESKGKTQHEERAESWPALPFDAWKDTRE
jgi:hypothetical protein